METDLFCGQKDQSAAFLAGGKKEIFGPDLINFTLQPLGAAASHVR